MSSLTITLLAIGIIVIAVSFFIPDKDEKQNKKDIEKQREEIRRLMESELDSMKLRVNEATNETVEYGMDKYERSLEKIANDKIMAVGEYATTVMEEIDRNHKEVLFLYDMLNDKQTDVKNSVITAQAAVREISDATRNANDTVANVVNSATIVKADMQASIDEYSEAAEKLQSSSVTSDTPVPEKVTYSGSPFGMQPAQSVFSSFKDADDSDSLITPINSLMQNKEEEPEKEEPVNEFYELQKTTFTNTSNKNQQIIMLNKEGKSVIEIAKQLELGVGEVQLVLDLFK